jgi:aldose 1-epimerase
MAKAPPPLHRLSALALSLAVAVCFSGVENAAAAAAAAAGSRKMVGVHELRIGDFSIKVTNWGATLMSVILPDSKGKLTLLFHASYEYSFLCNDRRKSNSQL